MKKFYWFGLLFLSFSAAHASTTYTTSTGAVFTQVQGPGNSGMAWVDPSGIVWSAYIGDYSNNATQPIAPGSYVLTDSPAKEACETIGAHLPPMGAFYHLLWSYFELQQAHPGDQNQMILSPQGQKDLFALFPDMQQMVNGIGTVLYPSKTLLSYDLDHVAGLMISTNYGIKPAGGKISIGFESSALKDDTKYPVHCINWTPVPSSAWKIVGYDQTSKNYCKNTNNGTSCGMTFDNAIAYCKTQGMHVPTAREAGLYIASQAHIAGVMDSGVTQEKWIKGALNPDGTVDSFYFEDTGFIGLDNPKFTQFWTSSKTNWDRLDALLFSSDLVSGGFTVGFMESGFGVACVADH